MHSHERSMISLVISGQIEEGCRSAAERFGPGAVSIKPRDVDHSNAVGRVGMSGLAITRNDDDSQLMDDWTAGVSRYRWLTGGPVVRAVFDIYTTLREPKGPDRALALDERLALMIGELGRPAPTPAFAPRWLLAVRDRLHALAEGAVPGARMAEFAGVHPVYLARAFRRHFGCCMSKYVQRLRVRRAAQLLQDRSLPAARIAQTAGFADEAHLCRVFKTEFGLTPGRYRRLVESSAP
jgi:AraC family transcriptional regulator